MTAVVQTPVARKRIASAVSHQSESERSSASSSNHETQHSDYSDLSDEEDVDLEVTVGDEDANDVEDDLHINGHSASVLSCADVPKGAWEGAPPCGQKGFNDFASRVMRAEGVGHGLQCNQSLSEFVQCPPLQPHQESVACLLQPGSPISRLLVYHPTGSGKTREMIQVLDRFFDDRRPKVPIFPKEPVCRNFYQELIRWPSRYRDFFAVLMPKEAAIASGTHDWRTRQSHLWSLNGVPQSDVHKLCIAIRDALEMKDWFFMGRMRKSRRLDFQRRFPGEHLPAAPLRALRYTSAGGSHAEIGPDGLPLSALFKVGFESQDQNVYSNKVVILDEAHNLVRTQTLFGQQLERLRKLLYGADRTVLAAFTGTPILNDPQDGRQLLDIVKGCGASPGDEGFISAFPMRPPHLFPQALPKGLPDVVLTPKIRQHFVKHIQLRGEPLQKYDKKHYTGASASSLRAYCNLCVHFGSFHEGSCGSRARILGNMEACAPKLHAIAQEVISCPQKSLVLIQRSSGMDVLLEHLRNSVTKPDVPGFGVATMKELAEFNSPANLHGEHYRVLIADSAQCSEGVSFLAVRRVHLADVPASFGAFMQSVGRAIRMRGHCGLHNDEWTVTTTLYVARLPRWLKSPLGVWAFRTQRQRANPHDTQARTRKLLRKLISLGVRSIENLKSRLDTQIPKQKHSDIEEIPGAVRYADFLEQLGLWDEARDMRNRQSARERRAKLLCEHSAQQAGGSGDPEGKHTRRYGKQVRVSKYFSRENGAFSVNVAQRREPRDRMLCALQALHSASSVDDAIQTMHLTPDTADEESLHHLVRSSREIVPALTDLHEKAVDRDILTEVMQEIGVEASSEGESSAYEFGISESSNDDINGDQQSSQKRRGPKRRAPGLALLPGWRIERVSHGKVMNREVVDPQGRRYKSIEKARIALDAARRYQNISQRLSAKFTARFGNQIATAS